MNHFNFKRRNLTSGPHLIGVLFILAGLFALLSPTIFSSVSLSERIMIVGIGAAALGLLIVTSYSGTFIDFGRGRLKEYTSVLGFKFGEWEALPKISEVKLIAISYVSRNNPNGISPTLSGRVTDYKTFLYSTGDQPFLSLDYSNKEKAVKQAKTLAAKLDADLVLKLPA